MQTAGDAHIALQMIDLAPPDLITADMMMPHRDGWVLLDQAHERHSCLTVILMSAGDWIRRRPAIPIPDHAVFLAKPCAVEGPLELVIDLIGFQSS